jgi:hypothetical protein
MLILLGNRNDEAQVGGDKFLFSFVALLATLPDDLGELYLLFGCNHRYTADFNKVFVK